MHRILPEIRSVSDVVLNQFYNIMVGILTNYQLTVLDMMTRSQIREDINLGSQLNLQGFCNTLNTKLTFMRNSNLLAIYLEQLKQIVLVNLLNHENEVIVERIQIQYQVAFLNNDPFCKYCFLINTKNGVFFNTFKYNQNQLGVLILQRVTDPSQSMVQEGMEIQTDQTINSAATEETIIQGAQFISTLCTQTQKYFITFSMNKISIILLITGDKPYLEIQSRELIYSQEVSEIQWPMEVVDFQFSANFQYLFINLDKKFIYLFETTFREKDSLFFINLLFNDSIGTTPVIKNFISHLFSNDIINLCVKNRMRNFILRSCGSQKATIKYMNRKFLHTVFNLNNIFSSYLFNPLFIVHHSNLSKKIYLYDIKTKQQDLRILQNETSKKLFENPRCEGSLCLVSDIGSLYIIEPKREPYFTNYSYQFKYLQKNQRYVKGQEDPLEDQPEEIHLITIKKLNDIKGTTALIPNFPGLNTSQLNKIASPFPERFSFIK